MSGKKLISETGLTTDLTGTKAELYNNRLEKFCVEIRWANGTGTLDSTVDIKYALTDEASPTSEVTDQVTLSTASGTQMVWIDPHELKYLQADFVINTQTSLDLEITSSLNPFDPPITNTILDE